MSLCIRCGTQLDPDGSCFLCGPGQPCEGLPAAGTTKPTRKLVAVAASGFKPARVRWGWEKRMPVGELTLIAGREGVGKSLFLAWLAAQITRGKLPGEFYGHPRSVLYVAHEDSWAYTIAPRLIAAGADLSRVYRLGVSDDDVAARLTLPRDCRLIPETAREVDAGALMFDPIVSAIDENLSVNQSRELRQALEPLRAAAEEAEIIVPALVHFNKATDVDVLSKIPGGRAWAEVARAALALARDEETGTLVCSQIKNNLGRLDLENLTYEITEAKVETDSGAASVGRLAFTGRTELHAGEVLERRPARRLREPSQAVEIAAWVNAQPAPVSVREVADAHPDVTYDNVKKALARSAGRGEITSPARGTYGPLREGR